MGINRVAAAAKNCQYSGLSAYTNWTLDSALLDHVPTPRKSMQWNASLLDSFDF